MSPISFKIAVPKETIEKENNGSYLEFNYKTENIVIGSLKMNIDAKIRMKKVDSLSKKEQKKN